ncbi:MAG: PAS domain S-box protein [bacterium]
MSTRTRLPLHDILYCSIYLLICLFFFLTYIRFRETIKGQKRLENIIRSIGPDVLLVTDAGGRILGSNSSLERVFGYCIDEIRNKEAALLFDEKNSCVRCPAEEDTHLKKDEGYTRLAFGKKKNGEIFPVEVIQGTLEGEGGSVLLLRDITERKKAEEALLQYKGELEVRVEERTSELKSLTEKLTGEIDEKRRIEKDLRRSEEKLTILFEYAPIAYFLNDIHGNILEANRVGKKMLNINGEGFLDRNILKLTLKSENDIRRIYRILARNAVGEPTGPDEFTFANKAGQYVTVELMTYPVKIAHQMFVLSTAQDITEHKRMENKNRKLQVQLFQSQKMEAMGRMIGTIAHDFNELLAPIRGCLEGFLRNPENDEPIHHNLHEIYDAAIGATNLAQQLLFFSGCQPVEKTILDLNGTIISLREMLNCIVGKAITIHTDLMPGLSRIRANQEIIEHMIMSLMINARDAMSTGGRITLKTEDICLDQSVCATISNARPGAYVRLTIRDTGMGMDEKTLQCIFEPFFSTKQSERKRGLGLAAVYGIVKQHGGWINVASELDVGTTFTIYLPTLVHDIRQEGTTKDSGKTLKGHGEHILLVEDNKAVYQFVMTALMDHGYVMFEAEGIREALEILSKKGKRIDLIICNTHLPDGTGVDLAGQVAECYPDTAILLSGEANEQDPRLRAVDERGYPFVQRPYDVVKLLGMIRQLLDGRAKGQSGTRDAKRSKRKARSNRDKAAAPSGCAH